MVRSPCCDKANVKKGSWSPEEDAKLKSFIEQNGTGGNWIRLPSKAGLRRCGKSCRLRWINYLRPDIKHGSFTEDEEMTIYRLHAQIGSRWSQIAAQLPGRTDNDIKNYWNTRLKKKLLERGNASRYGRHQSSQMSPHLFNQIGLEDQIESMHVATRDGLLHGHAHQVYNMNQQSYYQFYQQQQQHQGIPNPIQNIQISTFLRDQMNVRSKKAKILNEHQQQQHTVVVHTNGADEPETHRLMAIESSLRNLILTEENGSAMSGGGGNRRIPVRSLETVHPMQANLGNPMLPVTLATNHNCASPTSPCSNLSSDRNPFEVDELVDGGFKDGRYNAYDDPAIRDPASTVLNTSSPLVQPLRIGNPAATHDSLLAASNRFDDNVLFGEDVAVYNPPQEIPDVGVEGQAHEEGRDGGGASGDWWPNMGIDFPPENNVDHSNNHNTPSTSRALSAAATILPPSMNWSIATPRCGAENMIFTSPQPQPHRLSASGWYE